MSLQTPSSSRRNGGSNSYLDGLCTEQLRFHHCRASIILTTLLCAISVGFSMSAHSQSNSAVVLATPPMGWNSWNFFGRNVTDQDIRNAADQIVSTSMKQHGYVYVNLDGSWQGVRDANGVLHPNAKFPDMKALVSYVHSKGLKFGIYTSAGPTSCGGDAGSYGYEYQDAQMFANWGVDYLKFDLCTLINVMRTQYPGDKAAQMQMMYDEYKKMGDALKATGRPIVYSFCTYGWDAVWEWAPAAGGNLWRTGQDNSPTWDIVYKIIRMQEGLESYAGPGHWNDPDMLEVGNGQLTLPENKVHFSMWAMLSAPLLAGNDLPNMPLWIRHILNNTNVIALDQDPLGKQATHVYSDGEVDVWLKDLADGGKAIAIVNAGQDRVATHPFYLNLTKLNIYAPDASSPVTGEDLWTWTQVSLYNGMPILINSHDILLVRLPPGVPTMAER